MSPHVVTIETPTGAGTGFLALYNDDKGWCGLARASHVLACADEWQQLIRVTVPNSQPQELYHAEVRVIFLDHAADSAVLLCPKRGLANYCQHDRVPPQSSD